jgi:hypothetical protein
MIADYYVVTMRALLNSFLPYAHFKVNFLAVTGRLG